MTKKVKQKELEELELPNWMRLFKKALKDYVDQPVDENLNLLMRLSELYKDEWIKKVSQDGGFDDMNPSDYLDEAFRDDSEDQADMIDNPDGYVPFSKDALWNHYEKVSSGREKSYKVDDRTKEWYKKHFVKTEMSRVESPDQQSKLLTYGIYLPKHRDDKNERVIEELSTFQHSIRAMRSVKDQKSSRILNRRWYFENSKDKQKKVAWWAPTDQIEELIIKANNGRWLKMGLNDDRLPDSSINYIFSGDLDFDQKEEMIKDFALEEEREELMKEDYYFAIAEMHYPKTISQISDDGFGQRKSLWRDIMIWSPKKLTIRSTTNDRYHKPSETIPGSSWFISNDMTSIPNQVLRYFSTWLMDSSFKINE